MILPADFDHIHFAPLVFGVAGRYCTGRGLDLGCGDSQYPGSIPVDNGSLYEPADDLRPLARDMRDLGRFSGLDYIFSSHALEHVPEWMDVLGEAYRALRSGGVIFLYLPWDEHFDAWKPPEECRPDILPPWFIRDAMDKTGWVGHVASFKPSVIRKALAEAGFVELEGYEDEEGPDAYASFWVVGRKP